MTTTLFEKIKGIGKSATEGQKNEIMNTKFKEINKSLQFGCT